MPEVTLTGKPYSRFGTPAHTGPYSRLRGNYAQWIGPARQAWEMIVVGPYTVREAATALGMSPTTTWRRAWWYHDWIALNVWEGLTPGPVPHQRGTRAVPRGRPYSLPRDAPDALRNLRSAGCSWNDIIGSTRTIPKCIRDLAVVELDKLVELVELLDNAGYRDLVKRYPALRRDLADAAVLARRSTSSARDVTSSPHMRLPHARGLTGG